MGRESDGGEQQQVNDEAVEDIAQDGRRPHQSLRNAKQHQEKDGRKLEFYDERQQPSGLQKPRSQKRLCQPTGAL